MSREPLYLCGTTASGKTSLALALAEALDGEIVNGDAFQVYRGLEVLSAAPTGEERAQVPHHLFGILSLNEKMDAARYAGLAGPVIEEIQSRGKQPLIVGGSGLYLKFLTHGVSEAPSADPGLRAELEGLPVEEILRRLQALDPDEAARQIKQNSNNHRHLSRALEICLLTGGAASERRRNFEISLEDLNLKGVVLTWDREILAERIHRRTVLMLENGAIDEVRALPDNADTVKQAIGVKEIEAYLSGELSYEQCLEKIATSTRQYAKRQRNWFRREEWLVPIDGSQAIGNLVAEARRIIDPC
ncbi:tRNA (adenosine(37)-N6)-dimethylallyltransferase MiaA [Akkermansiaceae bacterium]|nr:tRNA (adenosine(37)-N6)-dimethylallyltransferase MiaA [Akkermansiaceae bacterium]